MQLLPAHMLVDADDTRQSLNTSANKGGATWRMSMKVSNRQYTVTETLNGCQPAVLGRTNAKM